MNGYLLDTDICVFFLRGKYGLAEKIDEVGKQNCYISEITIGELLYGAEYSDQTEKHLGEIAFFEKSFQVIPIYNFLKAYAKEKARLRREGNLIAEFDLLIGITAVQRDLTMITRNEKHFKRINGIRIENWIDEKYNKFL